MKATFKRFGISAAVIFAAMLLSVASAAEGEAQDKLSESTAAMDQAADPADNTPEETEEADIAPEADYPGFNIDKNNVITKYTGEGGVVNIPDFVTGIGKSAFSGNKAVTGVVIPDSVTSIAESAFNGCTALESVSIGSGVQTIDAKAFYDCSALKTVTGGAGVTSIGNSAFSGCTSLTGLTLGQFVQTIGNWTFCNCAFTSFTVPDSVTSIGEHAFSGCVKLESISLGQGLKTIGAYAFSGTESWGSIQNEYGCKALTEITIPANVETIGKGAFMYCYGLKKVTFKNTGALVLGESAFYDDNEIYSVDFGDAVTAIGNWSFGYCSKLTSIDLPDSVTDIGEHAFTGCSRLAVVKLGQGLKTLGAYAFSGHFSWGSLSSDTACANITTIDLPDSLTTVGNGAFAYCKKLALVTLSKNLEAVPYWMFYGCENLKSIDIPASVATIGESAFQGCSNMLSVKMNEGLTYIGKWAFGYCSTLKELIIPDTVKTIDEHAFTGCNSVLSLKLGNGLETIGSHAFSVNYSWGSPVKENALVSITDVVIPASVKTIGTNAFYYCSGLKTVKILGAPVIASRAFCACPSITTVDLGNTTSVANWAFEFSSSLKNLVIPSTVTSIGERAFAESGLTAITIPDSVETMGASAFQKCYSLKSAVIGNGLEEIPATTFDGCKSLEKVTIGTKVNTIYAQSFRDCTLLKSITIPDNVYNLYAAFTNCTGLTEAFIGENVTTITDNVFGGCTRLNKLHLPKNITNFGDSAFKTSPRLTQIYYDGTKQDWNAVLDMNPNAYMTSARDSYNVHCIDGDILGKYAVTVAKITVTPPTKTDYIIGDTLDLKGGKVNYTYSDKNTGSADLLISMLGDFDMNKVGKQTITVTYEDVVSSFNITVAEKPLPKIKTIVLTEPIKTTYTQGESLDLSGGKLRVTFEDGTVEDVELADYMITGFDNTKVGRQTLKIKYGDKTVEFTVNVNSVPNVLLDGQPVETLAKALKQIKSGDHTIELMVSVSEKTVTIPKKVGTITIKAKNGAVLKTNTISANSPLVLDGVKVEALKTGKYTVVKAAGNFTASGCDLGNVTVKGRASLSNVKIYGNLKLSSKADKTYATTDTLSNVTISKKVTSNNNIVFSNCPYIGTVTAKGNVTITGTNTSGVSVTAKATKGTTSLSNLTLTKKIYVKSILDVNGTVKAGTTISTVGIGSTSGANLSTTGLSVTKSGIFEGSKAISLTITDKKGNPVEIKTGKVAVKKFKGNFDAALLTLGGKTLVLKSGKLILA